MPDVVQKKPVTSADVVMGLRRLYAQPEWALLFEVGDATGARHTRFADAVAMSLWPSRGLTLTGIEIKVSRSDWTKERAQPQKAETIATFCDYWQLVTAPKVVLDVQEIPPAWGWLEFDGERFTTRKQPEKTVAMPITRQFLAALLRRAHKTDEAVLEAEIKHRNEIQEATFNDRVEVAASRRSAEYSNLKMAVDAFEAASGITITDKVWYAGLRDIARRLATMSSDIDKVLSDLGLPDEAPALANHVRKRRSPR